MNEEILMIQTYELEGCEEETNSEDCQTNS